MRTVNRKPCPRCGKDHSRKGFRYCDPCERIVIEEMKQTKYLEDRHLRAANVETGKVIPGAN